ncbi:MAG: RNA polymerase sigma factor [Planctomycetes bacterium]|nr:RNA polymerase sigma factor [Planctomycetota bacterium]
MEPNLSHPHLEDLLSHREWLAHLARRLVGDPAQVDDVVQETWLAGLHLERSPRHVRGWLRTVLRRTAWRVGREKTRRMELSFSQLAEEPAATDEALERVHLQARVARAVTRLDEPYRAAIVQRFFEDHPPREIARLQGVPVETVKSRIKRGLALLRGTLQSEFEEHGGLRALLPLAAGVAGRAGKRVKVPLPFVGAITLNPKLLLAGLVLAIATLNVFVFADPVGWRSGAATTTHGDAAELLTSETATEPGAGDEETIHRASPADDSTARVRDGLNVQVHAAGGGPLDGIPVAIGVVRNGSMRVLARETTQAGTGIATFASYPQGLAWQPGDEPIAFVLGHLRVIPSAPLPRGQAPEDPVVLTLGPHASVTVRVFDRENAPVDQGGTVFLAATRDTWPVRRGWTPLYANPNVQIPITEGEAHFPVVEPDAPIEVSALVHGLRMGLSSALSPVRSHAPAAGEHTTVLVHAPQPLVTGRILDENGELLRSARLPGWIEEQGSIAPTAQSVTVVTDAEGRFRLVALPTPIRAGSARSLLVAQRSEVTAQQRRVPAGAKAMVALPERLPEGRYDAGDLRLAEDPLLIAGRIVDPVGEGVAGISVFAAAPETDARLLGIAGLPSGNAIDGVTDAQGNFELRGVWVREQVKLVARMADAPPREALFARGTTDARIVLAATGSVRGRVLVDSEFANAGLRIRLRDERGNGADTSMATDGSFSIANLAVGIYTFSLVEPLKTQGQGQPPGFGVLEGTAHASDLVVVSDVRVDASVTAPPALNPLDLRGRLVHAALTLQSATGEPIGRRSVHLHGTVMTTGQTDGEGRIAWVASAPIGPVWISVPEYTVTNVENLQPGSVVRLERAPVVQLEPPGALPIPAGPRYLAVSLEPLDVPSGVRLPMLQGTYALQRKAGMRGALEFAVPWPGRWRVRWETGVHAIEMHPDAFDEGEVFVVEPSVTAQRFSVAVPTFE